MRAEVLVSSTVVLDEVIQSPYKRRNKNFLLLTFNNASILTWKETSTLCLSISVYTLQVPSDIKVKFGAQKGIPFKSSQVYKEASMLHRWQLL